MNNNIEYRDFELSYNNSSDDSRIISGLAIPVESRSQLLGGEFYETISRNAVTDELIRTNDVRFLVDHMPERGTLARSRYGEGSLRLFIEDDGLHFETELPSTAIGDEILVGIRRGDYGQMSFGFYCGEDKWTENVDGTYNREIRSIAKLVECSILSQAPAYEDTNVALRSLNEFKEQRAKEEEKQRAKEEEEEEKEEKETEEVQDEVKNEDEVKDEEKEEEKSEDEVENEDEVKDEEKEEEEPSEKEEEERKQSILKRLEELRTEINNLTKM